MTLLIIFIIATILFAVLAAMVNAGITHNFDFSVLTWINSHASPAFDAFFVATTQLGGVIGVTVLTLALAGYLVFKKDYPKAVLVAIGVGGATVLGFALKSLFDRPRPDLWQWIITETNFSFPSGHATASMALALCFVIVLWHTKWRAAAIVSTVAYVLLIGVSRLYLGVHFPTDILGGWLLSIAWVSLVAYTIQKYKRPKVQSLEETS